MIKELGIWVPFNNEMCGRFNNLINEMDEYIDAEEEPSDEEIDEEIQEVLLALYLIS